MSPMIRCAAAALIIPAAPLAPCRAAEQLCGPLAEILEDIEGRFAETPLAIGSTGVSGMMVLGNTNTGTWTILELIDDESACIVGAGRDLRTAIAVAGDPA